jgi:hypothetical protein
MLRRKPLILFALVFAVVALFAANEAIAQSTYPISWTNGDWEVVLTVDVGAGYTEWTYTATKLRNKAHDLSHWIVTAPANCIGDTLADLNEATTFTGPGAPTAWLPAAQGDSSCGTGVDDPSIHVAKFEPLPLIGRNESHVITIKIEGLDVGTGRMLTTIKPGNCIFFFIGGPYCPPEQALVVPNDCVTHYLPKWGPDERPAEVTACVTNGVPSISGHYTDGGTPYAIEGYLEAFGPGGSGNRLCYYSTPPTGDPVFLGCQDNASFPFVIETHGSCPECVNFGTSSWPFIVCYPDPRYCP